MDILPEIPTNSIVKKTITGIGATYGEIKANRPSIIIEPNVPVIVGKCKDPKHKDDNLFGVYEGVYTKDVVCYLEKTLSTGKQIKLLTTPESYRKIKEAFSELDMKASICFHLFDECEKTVQDVAYRGDIVLPIDDFFACENKAFVSATPILLTDPHFEEQGFQIIEVVPQYDYKKPIDVITTNNILETIRINLREYTDWENVCICFFLNSTDTIDAIIRQISIADNSAVFCSPKSVKKLKDRNFKHAYSLFDKDKVKTFNFFTSRFYSALDIELDVKPDIIMISDIYYAEHSMIDPHTEAIQIIGRFRNGVSQIKHITNFSKDFLVRSDKDIQEFLAYHEHGFTYLKGLADTCTDPPVKETLDNILEFAFYRQFLTTKGTKNYFAIDNYMDEAKVKSYYHSSRNIVDAYTNSDLIPTHKYFYDPLGDYERLKRERCMNLKELHKEVVEQMEMLDGENGHYPNETLRKYRDLLHSEDPFIVEAYEALGKDKLEELDYSRPKIKEAILLKEQKEGSIGFEVRKAIYNSFDVGKWYSVTEIADEIKRIYTTFKVRTLKAITGQTIKLYFETEEKRKGKEKKRGFVLRGRKF